MSLIVAWLALLVQIAATIFVISALLLAATLMAGAAVSRLFRWWNTFRIRADMSPNPSRGWGK